MMSEQPIIKLEQVCKTFRRDETQSLLVLDSIDLQLHSGEIVALLGKSGSGKSTLLRIIAGLISPTTGDVHYRGAPVQGPAKGITMVFQNFALLPWLTVLENVELGLEAQGVNRQDRRKRALEAIDTIGMDGFESAYPKELSGGMRQRVGFARALVVNPDILLMDEPFSALDVLTADNLRGDLIDLWQTKKTNTSCILLVTHNIEEAVTLADRILIFDSNPGRIIAELSIDMAQPRNEQDDEFRRYVDEIYTLITQSGTRKARAAKEKHSIGLGYRLPDAEISELSGLLETIAEPDYQGKMDLPELADILSLDIDDLFPLTEVLEILNFAQTREGDIELTQAGKIFAEADILERKKLFAKQLLTNVPLARHIRQSIDQRGGHRISKEQFLEELENHLSEKEALRVLRIAIDWGRYAEIFAYDDNSGILSLENPD